MDDLGLPDLDGVLAGAAEKNLYIVVDPSNIFGMTEHDREPPPIGKTIRWKNPDLDETEGGESDDNIAELVDIVPIDLDVSGGAILVH